MDLILIYFNAYFFPLNAAVFQSIRIKGQILNLNKSFLNGRFITCLKK